MDAGLALARYQSYAGSYRAYGWVGRLTLRQYMRAGRHLINPWLGRPDGCTRTSYGT